MDWGLTMDYYESTIAILASDARIGPLFSQTSPGDKSVLHMMLDRDNGAAMTSPGSPNDQLWSCLAEHGWMIGRDGLPESPVPLREYRLTEAGRRALPVLWDKLMYAGSGAG